MATVIMNAIQFINTLRWLKELKGSKLTVLKMSTIISQSKCRANPSITAFPNNAKNRLKALLNTARRLILVLCYCNHGM